MGHPISTDVIGAPTRWMLVFNRQAISWWTNFIAFGRYKHVRAFGYVHDADAYVFYDVQFSGTIIQIARGDGARALMLEWTANADVLRWDIGTFGTLSRRVPFVPFLCTTAIAHLIGLPGALLTLRPDALYRACIESGAVAIHGLTGQSTPAPAGSDARQPDGDGGPPAAERAAI